MKLYEMDCVSTDISARLARTRRDSFLFEHVRFGLMSMGLEPDEIVTDLANT